jgi:hypothetical protein
MLTLVAGCGRIAFDEPGSVTDASVVVDTPPEPPNLGFNPYGHWTVTRVHAVGGGTLGNDNLVNGFRGDLWFDADGTFRSRAMQLQSSLPVARDLFGGPIQYGDHEYVISIATAGVTAVYTTTVIDADHVHAVWIPADPRNVGVPGYDVFDMVRTPELPTEIIGSMSISRMAFETIPEFATGSCLPMGGTSSRITGTNTIDENFIVTTHAVFDTYGDGACGGAPTEDVSDASAFLDKVDADYVLWSTIDNTKFVRMTCNLTVTPTSFRFVRTNCELDSTECANDLTVLEVPR